MTLEQAMKEIDRKDEKLRSILGIAVNLAGTSDDWERVYEQADQGLGPPTRAINYLVVDRTELPDGYLPSSVAAYHLNRPLWLKFTVKSKEIPL